VFIFMSSVSKMNIKLLELHRYSSVSGMIYFSEEYLIFSFPFALRESVMENILGINLYALVLTGQATLWSLPISTR